MSTSASALPDDARARISAAAQALADTELQLTAQERTVWENIADAHPDPPAPGEKPVRGPQQELAVLTGWSTAYLRRIRTQIRNERGANGRSVRQRGREAAVATVTASLPHVRRLRQSKAEQLRALADTIESAVPYTGPRADTPSTGPRQDESIRTLYQELSELTGYSTRPLDRMRRDAASRRQDGRDQLAGTHQESDGSITPGLPER